MAVSALPSPRFTPHWPGYGWFVAAVVLVWGVGDVASTLLAVELTDSIAMEGNPLMRAVLAEGAVWLALVKGGVVGTVGALLVRFRENVEGVPAWELWFSLVLTVGSFIVVTNVYVGVGAVL